MNDLFDDDFRSKTKRKEILLALFFDGQEIIKYTSTENSELIYK